MALLLVAAGMAAQPRPISEDERAAVAVVAAYLAHGPDAVYARLAEDAPLRALPRAEAVREIAAVMGSREIVTWTLRTAERDAAFRVAWARGGEDEVWLRMRGERVLEIRTPAPPPRNTKAAAGPPHSRWFFAAGALAVLGMVIAVRWRLVAALVLGLAGAAAVIGYRQRAPEPAPVIASAPLAPVRDEVVGVSRDAELYYRAAADTKSFDALQTAWRLEPKPREELIRAGLVDDLRAKSLVSFFAATEPVRRSAQLATRPVTWPASARAFAAGELLRAELGNAAIEVPNGAALAPRDAQVVPATVIADRREAAALRDAHDLLQGGGRASRTRATRAVKALASRNRWTDVVKLTQDLPADAPADVLVLRVYGLLRLDRLAEARALADTAAVRAVSGNARAVVDARMRQLELRRTFAASARTIATEHFDIRHEPELNPAIASRIGDFLEAELARVRRKLPPFEPRRTTVNVLRWDAFRNGITQSDHIVGLYDGEIFFPFAAVEQFKPEVVSIITHELTHALVAQVTGENAPRWFHEGVASRMEFVERQENAFSSTPPGLVLPVTLLDAMMEKTSERAAYVVAQTFIHFLEDRHGADAIAKLASGFARGEDAVLKLTGKSLDALNVEFRQWGFHHNGAFVNEERWLYGKLYSPGIDPRIRAGFKFRGKDQ